MSSDILFSRASFLSGAARTFDLWGHLDTYNYSRTPEEADSLALYSDWRTVGEHIFSAAENFDAREPEQLNLFAASRVDEERAASK